MSGLSRLAIIAASSIILVSISSASILVLLSGAQAEACAFWRLTISCLILLTASIASGSLKSLSRVLRDSRLTALTIASGLALAAHFILWMRSLFLIPVAVSVTLVTSYPLINLIIDYLLLHERVRLTQAIALMAGFTAVALFMSPKVSGVPNVLGSVLAFAGAIAASAYFSAGRVLRRFEGVLEYGFSVYGVAAAAVLTYSVLVGVNLINYSARTYAFLVMLALIPMLGGHTLMNYLLKYMKSSAVTSIAIGEPVGASLLAYALLHQVVSPAQAVLMCAALASIITVIWGEVRHSP